MFGFFKTVFVIILLLELNTFILIKFLKSLPDTINYLKIHLSSTHLNLQVYI